MLPAGETAVLVLVGDRIAPALNDRVHALTAALSGAPWVLELTPGYASLLVEFDPAAVAHAEAEAAINQVLTSLSVETARSPRLRQVPTVYGGEYGPDLPRVAQQVGLSEPEVVRLHAEPTYRVYIVGFAPGHPYIGDLPPQLAIPRLATPRTAVPPGSVAIAGGQTVIYPASTPGGWSLIGRTALRLFDPAQDPPAYFSPGDQVQFVPVDHADIGDATDRGDAAALP